MTRRRVLPSAVVSAVVASAFFATGCGALRTRGAKGAKAAPPVVLTPNEQSRRLLCPDVGESACLAACPDGLAAREHAECLIDLRFQSDPEARSLARALYGETNTMLGVEQRSSIDGYKGHEVELFPALPIGEHRHHLEWLRTSLESFDAFVEALRPYSARPITFRVHPTAFIFFRTAGHSYPSAYSWQGTIGYNVDGPLHTNARDVHETLFHELFHLNDSAQSPSWSASVLAPLFESIIARCGEDHACFAPFAPHDTVVPGGTYYAFDPRSREVREYAAELALRYLVEHEAILAGRTPVQPPFKCLTDENRVAWDRLADAFFGGADLTPACDEPEGLAISR